EDGIRGKLVTGVQTCALPISPTTPDNSRARYSATAIGNALAAISRRPDARIASMSRSKRLQNCAKATAALIRNSGIAIATNRLRSEERRVGKEGSQGGATCQE